MSPDKPLSSQEVEKLERWVDCMETATMAGQHLETLGQLLHSRDLVRAGTAFSGLTKIVFGVGNMIQAGALSLGSIGMVLGGLNLFMSCFGDSSDEDNGLGEALSAIFENLRVISTQIYNLHKDMIEHFGRVFMALGIIHHDLIQGFADTKNDIKKLSDIAREIKAQNNRLNSSMCGVGEKVDSLATALSAFTEKTDYNDLRRVLNSAMKELNYVDKERHDKHHKQIIDALTFLAGELHKRGQAIQSTTSDILAAHLDTHDIGAALPTILPQLKILLKPDETRGAENKSNIESNYLDPYTWLTASSALLDLAKRYQAESGAGYRVPDRFYNNFEMLRDYGQAYLDIAYKIDKENVLLNAIHAYQKILGGIIETIQGKIQYFEEHTLVEGGEVRVHPAKQKAEELRDYFSRTCFVAQGQKQAGYVGFQMEMIQQLGHPAVGPHPASLWFQVRVYPWSPFSGYGNQYLTGTKQQQLEQYYVDQKGRLSNDVSLVSKRWTKKITDLAVTAPFFSFVSIKKEDGLFGLETKCLPSQPTCRDIFIHKDDAEQQTLQYTHPLLPLPEQMPMLDAVFTALEHYGVGEITYVYDFNDKTTPATLTLSAELQLKNDKKEKLPLWAHTVAFAPPFKQFNPESVWNSWVGGQYASQNDMIVEVRNRVGHHQQWYYAPLIENHAGLRDQIIPALSQLSVSAEVIARANEILTQHIADQRKEIHQHIQSLFESQSARTSPLAEQLNLLHRYTQLIRAILAITQREELILNPIVSNSLGSLLVDRNKVLEFLASYSSQGYYLHHYLVEHYNIMQEWQQQLSVLPAVESNGTAHTGVSKEAVKQHWCAANYPEICSVLDEWNAHMAQTKALIIPERDYEKIEKIEVKIEAASDQIGEYLVHLQTHSFLKASGFSEAEVNDLIGKPIEQYAIDPQKITEDVKKGLYNGAYRKTDEIVDELENKLKEKYPERELENKKTIKILRTLKQTLRDNYNRKRDEIAQQGNLLKNSMDDPLTFIGFHHPIPVVPPPIATPVATAKTTISKREWSSPFFCVPQLKLSQHAHSFGFLPSYSSSYMGIPMQAEKTPPVPPPPAFFRESSSDGINTNAYYDEVLIYKVWDAYIRGRNLQFWCHDEGRTEILPTLFTEIMGERSLNILKNAGLLINSDGTLYRREDSTTHQVQRSRGGNPQYVIEDPLAANTHSGNSQIFFPLSSKDQSKEDTAWYSDDEMQILLNHYSKQHPDVTVLNPMLGNNWQGEEGTVNTLKENLIEFHAQRLTSISSGRPVDNKVIIPINLNQNHWVFLYLCYTENNIIPSIYYFDPFGEPVPAILQSIIKNSKLYPQAKITPIGQRTQYDGYNCGPWVIEAARAILEGREVDEQLAIAEARRRHREIISSVDDTQRANMSFRM
jgi:hypothetical protein